MTTLARMVTPDLARISVARTEHFPEGGASPTPAQEEESWLTQAITAPISCSVMALQRMSVTLHANKATRTQGGTFAKPPARFLEAHV